MSPLLLVGIVAAVVWFVLLAVEQICAWKREKEQPR